MHDVNDNDSNGHFNPVYQQSLVLMCNITLFHFLQSRYKRAKIRFRQCRLKEALDDYFAAVGLHFSVPIIYYMLMLTLTKLAASFIVIYFLYTNHVIYNNFAANNNYIAFSVCAAIKIMLLITNLLLVMTILLIIIMRHLTILLIIT